MKTSKNQSNVYIGIDTGKHSLDVHIRPLDIDLSVTNDISGVLKFRLKNNLSLHVFPKESITEKHVTPAGKTDSDI